MFNREQLDRIEQEQSKQNAKLDRILRLLKRIFEEFEEFEDEPGAAAVSATLEISKGENSMFTKVTFKEFLANGKQVKTSGPITFASDNLAAVTVDSTKQTLNADGLSVDCPIVETPGAIDAVANLTGVDPASVNKLAAGAVDAVPATAAVPTSATLTLS